MSAGDYLDKLCPRQRLDDTETAIIGSCFMPVYGSTTLNRILIIPQLNATLKKQVMLRESVKRIR